MPSPDLVPNRQLISLHHPDLSLSQALTAAEQVAQRLRSLSIGGGPSALSTQFYTRVRVKSRRSIRDKVARNQRYPGTPASYSFADLDDLVGFRLVTLYDDDLITDDHNQATSAAMAYIIDLVIAAQHSAEPLFAPGLIWTDSTFMRGKFFRRSSSRRDIYVKCNQWLQQRIARDCAQHGISPERFQECCEVRTPSEAEHEYSSGHLTFFAHAYTAEYIIPIPVEFQFRTASEDYWSEINHKLLYKIANPNAWSPGFAHYKALAEKNSGILKEVIDRLPLLIKDLLNNSPHAQRELGKFTEPDSFFHFSLIASLFWFIDTKHKHLFRKPFDDFEGVIEELLHTTGIENAAALLGTAVNIVTEIASTVRNLTNLENESTEKEILRQQLLLIQFEDIRLRTLLAIEYQYTMRGKRAVPLKGPNARVKNRPLYIKLYGELCRIKDDRALMLRPLSVLLFWKYLLAKEFDPATARLNLMDAAEELKLDPCVPRYSVYRVLIPRHLAMILSEEAITTFETVDAAVAGGPIKMPGLAKEIQSKLIDALRYALDAFNVTVEEVDPRRGDLLFSPKRLDDALKDAAQVIKIYLFYVTKFREAITVRAGSIRLNNLVEVVNHVRQETLVRFLPESEQEAFYFNLAAVESSLDREQQPKTMGDSNAT